MSVRGGLYAPLSPLSVNGEEDEHGEHTRLTETLSADEEQEHHIINPPGVVVHEEEEHSHAAQPTHPPSTPSHEPPTTPPTEHLNTARRKKSPRVDKVVQEVVKNKMIRLFVGTWNMEGKPPPSGSLSPFITAYTHHIYAIGMLRSVCVVVKLLLGTQECETSIQRALLSPPKLLWEEKLLHLLGPDYILLQSCTLGATHLGIFIHSALMPLISQVRSQVVPTGIGKFPHN